MSLSMEWNMTLEKDDITRYTLVYRILKECIAKIFYNYSTQLCTVSNKTQGNSTYQKTVHLYSCMQFYLMNRQP